MADDLTVDQRKQLVDAQEAAFYEQAAAFRAQAEVLPRALILIQEGMKATPFVPADYDVRRTALLAAATLLQGDEFPEIDFVAIGIAQRFEAYLREGVQPSHSESTGLVQYGDPCPDCGGHLSPANDEPDALRCDDVEGCGFMHGPAVNTDG